MFLYLSSSQDRKPAETMGLTSGLKLAVVGIVLITGPEVVQWSSSYRIISSLRGEDQETWMGSYATWNIALGGDDRMDSAAKQDRRRGR